MITIVGIAFVSVLGIWSTANTGLMIMKLQLFHKIKNNKASDEEIDRLKEVLFKY